MATLSQIRGAVSQLLARQGVAAALQLNSNTRERAFEVYLFALLAEAVRRAGGTVELHGILSGPRPGPLVFRGSPGQIASRAQNFCYARCTLGAKEFEIHVDVEYSGTSGATHEIDVSVCEHSLAQVARQTPGALPQTRKVRAAIECKFYDSALGTASGRTFVGLVADCGDLQLKIFATNGSSDQLAAYFSPPRRPEAFFGVSPIIPGNSERLVGVVEQALRKWAAIP